MAGPHTVLEFQYPVGYGVTVDKWVPLTGLDALLSESADDPEVFPADLREAAMATYRALLAFKENCPCACPREEKYHTYDFTFQSAIVHVHRKTVIGDTSCGEAQDPDTVKSWLVGEYPGPNKVETP